MSATKIEWATDVWNPVVGCTRVSEGCRNCYAERMAKRLQAMGTRGYEGVVDQHGRWTGRVNIVESALHLPLKATRPRIYFVNSMSDLFHESVAFDRIDRIYGIMRRCPRHRFIVLTKRPARMCEYLQERGESLPNVVWGVSVEDQATADERIPLLLAAPARWRCVSVEPLLGPVSLDQWIWGNIGEQKLHWVIVGGESGPHARPMRPEWVWSLRDDCAGAGVAFFFKQWGEFAYSQVSSSGALIPPLKMPTGDHEMMKYLRWTPNLGWVPPGPNTVASEFFAPGFVCVRVGKAQAGCLLDGIEHHEYPEGFHHVDAGATAK